MHSDACAAGWRSSVCFVLLLAAVAVGGLMGGGGGTTAAGTAFETEELAPALAAKLAANASSCPGNPHAPGGRPRCRRRVRQAAAPGDSVPAAAIQQALADWKKVKGRATGGKSDWKPLGPCDAQGLHNKYRDRSVYNAGTAELQRADRARRDRSGLRGERRSARSGSRTRTAASGGRTTRSTPSAEVGVRLERLRAQQHRVDRARPERQAGPTRSGSARASPTPAAAAARPASGIYKSHERREHVESARSAATQFDEPRRRLDRGQAGQLEHDLRGLGPRASAACRTSAAAAPTRSSRAPRTSGCIARTNGGAVLAARQPGRAGALHASHAGRGVAERDAVLAARRAPRHVRPGRPEHRLRVVLRARHLALDANGDPTWEQIMRAARRRRTTERAEFDVVALPNGETRMYVGVGGGGVSVARFRRNDAVRSAPAAAVRRPGSR